MVARGLYFHPGHRAVAKPRSFVGNTVEMMMRMLTAAPHEVSGKTFYCTDYPATTVHDWADLIQKATGVPKLRVAPLPILRFLAAVGSGAKVLGWNHPPLTLVRLNAMLTEMRLDTTALEALVGPLPYDLETGIDITLKWLRDEGMIKGRN